MGPRGSRGRLWAALAGAAAIAIGCSATPTGTPAPTASSPIVTVPSPAALTPSPGPTDGPFVAANVLVSLEKVADVERGALAIAFPDDGSGRMLIATQQGLIWSATNGTVEAQPLLDISARITSGGERGLLGLAAHPGFATDQRIFVDYTDRNGDTVVSSFDLTPDRARFDPGSESIILQVEQPFANHNGGGIAFGPDGDLYIALGDGGGGGDPQGNGQNLDALLAKLLRVDVDHPSDGLAYGIPAGNPFADRAGARPEVWLYGLRNPWRFSFDRVTTDLWIGDVGQNRFEEVDVVRAGQSGLNFGWNVMEGAHCYEPRDGCNEAGLTLPVSEYGHSQGCAVIGGFVYRGAAYPLLRGGYLFSDSCSGTIWAIPAATNGLVQPVPVGEASGSPAGFGEDPSGELYLANLDGTVSRITATSR